MKRKKKASCPHCRDGVLTRIPASAPENIAHWQCKSCDSTYLDLPEEENRIPMHDAVQINLWDEALSREEVRTIIAMIIAEMGAKIFRDPKSGTLYLWRYR